MQSEVKDFRRYKPFEYWYFFLMMIELGYLTPETRVMNGGLSHPVAFAIPFILTVILAFRNKVKFGDRRLWRVVIIMLTWCILQATINQHYELDYIGSYFVRIYVIFVAYIHIKVYKNSIFPLFEQFVVFFCKISIPLWILSMIIPGPIASFFQLMPRTGLGHHLFYIYNQVSSNIAGTAYYGIKRNSGFCWEPGFFAMVICLALLVNLFRNNGIKISKNSNVVWLIVALLSTMSTTGYFIAFVSVMLMTVKQFSAKNVLAMMLIFIPLGFGMLKLDFMEEKIIKNINLTEQMGYYDDNVSYFEKNDEKLYAMNRFLSFHYQAIEFAHAPIIGFGVNYRDCVFYKDHPSSISFTGGLMQVFSQYGIFVALFLFSILIKSSQYIAQIYNSEKKWMYLIFSLLEMISYPMFTMPLLTAIWFISYFSSQPHRYATASKNDVSIVK